MPIPNTTLPPTLTMRHGRDRYLAGNGFTVASYDDPTVTVKLAGVPVTIRNTANRKKAIPFHDLHHVALGYGTDWIGEGEIGAWEVRTGCTSFIAYYLNTSAMVIGLCLNPWRIWRAWQLAKGQRSFYRHPLPYDSIMAMSLGDVRQYLGLPVTGQAEHPARRHPDAPVAQPA